MGDCQKYPKRNSPPLFTVRIHAERGRSGSDAELARVRRSSGSTTWLFGRKYRSTRVHYVRELLPPLCLRGCNHGTATFSGRDNKWCRSSSKNKSVLSVSGPICSIIRDVGKYCRQIFRMQYWWGSWGDHWYMSQDCFYHHVAWKWRLMEYDTRLSLRLNIVKCAAFSEEFVGLSTENIKILR